MLNLMREAGFGAWLCLLAALAVLVVAGVGVVFAATGHRAGRLLGAAGFAGALGIVILGFLFRTVALGRVEEATANVDPADQAMIRAVGGQEAQANVTLACAFAVLPGLVSLAAFGIGLSKK